MSNKIINNELFLKEAIEFHNTEDDDKKYQKGLKLINDIDKVKDPNERDELLFYSFIAELYCYMARIESQKYKISDGSHYNVEVIQDENNKQFIEKILKYKMISFDNYKKALDDNIIKKSTEKMKEFNKLQEKQFSESYINKQVFDLYYRNKEGLRILAQDLSNIYYILNDEENFILYGKEAVEYESLNVIGVFLKYYCNKLDYNNAHIYYELMHNFDSKNFGTNGQNIVIKLYSYANYYNFLYDLGLYEDSLKVAKEAKKYYIHLDLDMNQYETLKFINTHIKKCEEQINKTKDIKYSEDKLLNYFDKEILELISNDNKIYILTSLNIYEYMKTTEMTMDYSAALMPILKAIENIMFEILAINYHSFIVEVLEQKQIDKRDIKGFLNKDNEFITEIDKLDYGKILSLIGRKSINFYDGTSFIIPNRYFTEFCNKNNIINSKSVIIKIYNELDKLKDKRNLVAHKNRVYEDCVKECYDILLDNIKFINYLYTNFKFIFENNKNDIKD